jgi:hypothetical protein
MMPVPVADVADINTVPVPHLDPLVPVDGVDGIAFTVAVTAVLSDSHPLPVLTA